MRRLFWFVWVTAVAATGIIVSTDHLAVAGPLAVHGEVNVAIREMGNLVFKRINDEILFPEDYLLLQTDEQQSRVPVTAVRYMQRVSIQGGLYAVEFTRTLDKLGDRGLFKVVFPQEIRVHTSSNSLAASFLSQAQTVVDRLLVFTGKSSALSGQKNSR